MLESLEQIRVEQARKDPNAFLRYCFRDQVTGEPVRQQWFHRKWQRMMGQVARLLIIAPRNHGKTTQVVARIIWELGNNPNLRIKIVCQSDSKAVERLYEIRQHLELNPLVKKVFPNMVPAEKGDWSKHKIVVQRTTLSKDASIEALGIISTATGGRCDILVADDVVDRRNAIQYPALRETVKQSWKSDWTNLLEPGGRIWYICTLWHTADLSHELVNNPAYTVVKNVIDDSLEPIWPEKWPREALLKRKLEIGTVEFDRAFKNIALSGEIVIVQDIWIHYYPEVPKDIIRYAAYDLAIAKSAGSDYFASVGGGWSPSEQKAYITHAWQKKLTFNEQILAVKREARLMKPIAQGLESGAYQDALRQFLVDTTMVPVVPVSPGNIPKPQRLQRITVHLENGKILFAPHLNPQNPYFEPMKGDLITQLLQAPLAAHDDLQDAFVYLIMMIMEDYLELIDPDADLTPELETRVTVVG